jgi:predicted heme/steroid binding protein
MNWKGVLLAAVGGFLIYMAVNGTYKDVWKAISQRKGTSNGGQ